MNLLGAGQRVTGQTRQNTFLTGLTPDPMSPWGGTESPMPSLTGPKVPDSKKRIGKFGLDPVTGLTEAGRRQRFKSIMETNRRKALLGGLEPNLSNRRILKNYYYPPE